MADRCPGCGGLTADDQRYCIACGGRLSPTSDRGPKAGAGRGGGAAATAKRPTAGGERAGVGAVPAWLAWAPRVVTDRRWAGPLSACALGMGLFIGVAVGPGAPGGLAGQIIRVPASLLGGSGGGGGAPTAAGNPHPGAPLAALGSPVGDASVPAPAPSPVIPAPLAAPFVPSAPSQPSGGPTKPTQEPSGPTARPNPPAPHQNPPPPKKQEITGVVVHLNPPAHSYVIAAAGGGDLNAVHAADLPTPGAKLKVAVRELFNGTYTEAGPRQESGKASNATITGIVTYRDPASGAYVVSKRGVSMRIGVKPDPGAAPEPPELGSYVSVGVQIEQPPAARRRPTRHRATEDPQPCTPDATPDPPPQIEPAALLWQRSIEIKDHFTYSDFEGIVESCPEAGRLVLSADDIREGGADLSFTAEPGIDLSKLYIGESVDVAATIGAQGALSLTGAVSDQGGAGANDGTSGQGDLAG